MTTVQAEAPARLAATLEPVRHLLGDAQFIGRHQGLVETNDDGSRWYYDPQDPTIRYQSVTWTIGSTESAPWLAAWAAGLAADVTIDNWADLGDMAAAQGWPAVRRWLAGEAKLQRELAADIGTWLHDVLEARLLGMPVPGPPEHVLGRTLKTGGEVIPVTDQTLQDWAVGVRNFLDDFRPRPVMSEATVANPIEGYAARVDLGAEFPGHGLGLVDAKSGAVRASATAQLTAQRHATEVWLPLGDRVEMPAYEWGAVLHVRPKWARGYKLRRVPTGPGEWAWFRAMNRLLIERERDRPDGQVLYPPVFDAAGEAAALVEVPMVEDLPVRCVRELLAAGVTRLDDLAVRRVEDVLSDPKAKTGIPRVGQQAVKALRALLAEHGLAFVGDATEQTAEVA